MRMNANAGRIPVLFCIDAEPDPRLVNRDAPEPWEGYEVTHRYLARLRPRIEEATGSPVRYCWFFRMDPQIAESYKSATWAADRYPEFLEANARHGDEAGIHTHAFRWREWDRTWVLDLGSQTWVEHCVGSSLEAFSRAFGRSCTSFRFGNRWLNTATVNFLERMGVRHELTVEPGARGRRDTDTGEETSGPLPGFGRVPREPYAPSESDFRKPARDKLRKIQMIPLTAAYREGLRLSRRAWRFLRNGPRGRFQDTVLAPWMRWKPPNTFDRMIDRALNMQERPYLALVSRSDVGADRKLFERFEASVEAILAHPARDKFLFCTPAEALAMMQPGGR